MQRPLFPMLHPKSQMLLLFSNFGKTQQKWDVNIFYPLPSKYIHLLILFIENNVTGPAEGRDG